ncbi:ABC-type transport system periplasmic substrate-binding protein (probable substrate branched-chain amino acids) [Halobacterium hubeiense]|nr:ABC transporter substrate-binding protein [Halobacterium hubeiense]CQH56830.1 ABC-type transport system periplasmic substrate-binding protein (probable substrate branched-chain amino acids) [Halobacterium hubeiense]
MVDSDRSHSRRTYLKTLGAAGTVGMSGLAGCTLLGGGGGGGSETVTIAATVPESGQFSSLGEAVKRGYELGVARMDEQLDADVELIMRDDESDPELVRQNLTQITSNNQVDMIWGSFSSLLVTAGSAYAESQGIPFVGAFFAYEGPHRSEGYEWTYSPFPKSRDVARSTRGLLELIPEGERPTNVGLWEPNSGWGEEQADYWEETLTDAGYDVVMRETFSLGNQDFSTLISQSESANVEALLSTPTPPGGITAVNQMRENNWSPDLLKFVRAADPTAWWTGLEESGAYACMCPGWVPGLTGGGNEAMWSAYESEYGLDDGELIRTPVGGAYNVAQTALQAIQGAESTDPGALQETFRSETFETVIGSFGFEDNGLPAEGDLTAPTGQWWEGNQHTVYPDTDGRGAIDFQYPIPAWSER